MKISSDQLNPAFDGFLFFLVRLDYIEDHIGNKVISPASKSRPRVVLSFPVNIRCSLPPDLIEYTSLAQRL